MGEVITGRTLEDGVDSVAEWIRRVRSEGSGSEAVKLLTSGNDSASNKDGVDFILDHQRQ